MSMQEIKDENLAKQLEMQLVTPVFTFVWNRFDYNSNVKHEHLTLFCFSK